VDLRRPRQRLCGGEGVGKADAGRLALHQVNGLR
jgi:hypothetical protein